MFDIPKLLTIKVCSITYQIKTHNSETLLCIYTNPGPTAGSGIILKPKTLHLFLVRIYNYFDTHAQHKHGACWGSTISNTVWILNAETYKQNWVLRSILHWTECCTTAHWNLCLMLPHRSRLSLVRGGYDLTHFSKIVFVCIGNSV